MHAYAALLLMRAIDEAARPKPPKDRRGWSSPELRSNVGRWKPGGVSQPWSGFSFRPGFGGPAPHPI